MADTKITGLTNFDSSNTPYWPPAPASDVIPIVDISDNTMAASGTTKKISINNLLSSSPTATGALTVTGLVTAGSASITGDLTVDTSTLKVDSGANKVGIGTTTMNGVLTVKNPNVAVDSSIYTIQAATSTSQLSSWTINQNTDVVSFGTDYAGALSLKTNSVERCNISSSGNVNISTGNVVMATSGRGIDFSATANSSGTMTSELLNDYEEGTFTATLTGLTTGPTVPVTATGRYTKIGREVKVSFFFNNVSTVGASGNMRVTGLPFTSANDGVGAWGVFTTHQAATFTGYAAAELGPNTTIMEFPWYQSANVSGYSTHNAGLNRYVGATLMYNV